MGLFYTNMSFSLHKMLTDGLEWSRLLWCFYQLFGLSFWRHPFTAEDPLVSKWCNATFLQICFWWRDKLIYILDGLRTSTFSAIFLNIMHGTIFYNIPQFVFCSAHIKNRIYGTSFCRLSGLPWGKPSSCTLHTSPTLVLESGKMVKMFTFSQFSFVHNQYSHAHFAKHSVSPSEQHRQITSNIHYCNVRLLETLLTTALVKDMFSHTIIH